MPETPAQVIAAWEAGAAGSGLAATFDNLGLERELWVDVAAAVSCWPGLPVSIERRLVLDSDRRVRQFLLISALGLGSDDVRAAIREATALVAPVLDLLGAVPCKPSDALALSALIEGMEDVAEIRALSPSAPEGPRSFGLSLARTISTAYATLPADSTFVISFLLRTPQIPDPPLEYASPFPGLVMPKMPRRGPSFRPIAFRMRLAATVALPRAVIATAASVALEPEQLGGLGWCRPRTAGEKRFALDQMRSLGTAPWGTDGAHGDTASTANAATVMSLPITQPVHAPPDFDLDDAEHDDAPCPVERA